MTTTLPRFVIPVTDLLPGRRVMSNTGPGTIIDARLTPRPKGLTWEYAILHDNGGESGGVQRSSLTPTTPAHPMIPADALTTSLINEWLAGHPDCDRSPTYSANHLIGGINRRLRSTQIDWCSATWYDNNDAVSCGFMREPGHPEGLCGWHATHGHYPMHAPAGTRERPYISNINGRSFGEYLDHLLDITIDQVMHDPKHFIAGGGLIAGRTLRIVAEMLMRDNYGCELADDDGYTERYEDAVSRAVRAGRVDRIGTGDNNPTREPVYQPGGKL